MFHLTPFNWKQILYRFSPLACGGHAEPGLVRLPVASAGLKIALLAKNKLLFSEGLHQTSECLTKLTTYFPRKSEIVIIFFIFFIFLAKQPF